MRATKIHQIGDFKVEIKTYTTPREMNALRCVDGFEKGEITPKHEEALIEQLVVSVNDNSENVLDYILENFNFMTDYVKLIEIIGEILSQKK